MHKYLYTGNDPVNKWDPSGKSTIIQFLVANLGKLVLAAGVVFSLAVFTHVVLRENRDPYRWANWREFRDFAYSLSNQDPEQRDDCSILAQLVGRASQIWTRPAQFVTGLLTFLTEYDGPFGGQSPGANRVGVFGMDPFYGRGFGTNGFRGIYWDPSPRRINNQVRHFIGWFAVGYYYNHPIGTSLLLEREIPGTEEYKADVGLGIEAIDMGIRYFHEPDPSRLVQEIKGRICGP